ncbi:MAG: hypothetical protein LUD81_10085 [Clostridiales bacterium]|nr:hypothetical protein [Clostridiales bacterium]
MVNSIIEGISLALYGEFGEGYTIYKEEVKQGLERPCFFIQCLNPKIERFMGVRYYRQNQFAIQYFPESEDYNEEIFDVIDRMYTALEFITACGNLIMGKGIETSINEGILTFVINYDMFVAEYKEKPKMEEMELSEGLKIILEEE